MLTSEKENLMVLQKLEPEFNLSNFFFTVTVQTYKPPVSATNSKQDKHVHFEDQTIEKSDDDEEEETDDNSSDSSEEDSDDDYEEEEESLLLLEDHNTPEIILQDQPDKIIVKGSENGFQIPTNSMRSIVIQKPKDDPKDLFYNFELTKKHLVKSLWML